jgi:ankyrin repeat protein
MDLELRALFDDIVHDRGAAARQSLKRNPALARETCGAGATRTDASTYFFEPIKHYVYAGDTALHVAAAAFRASIATELVVCGADVEARNRRGAAPLHYAADANIDAAGPQGETVAALLAAGADPNARDRDKTAPLHRAVRTRAVSAVEALLRGRADVNLANGRGSTPLHLAVQNTGRGERGEADVIARQRAIILILLAAGARADMRDGNGRTVYDAATAAWVHSLLRDSASRSP